eukprot:1191483-Prorocentrum_minimum.AAC.3
MPISAVATMELGVLCCGLVHDSLSNQERISANTALGLVFRVVSFVASASFDAREWAAQTYPSALITESERPLLAVDLDATMEHPPEVPGILKQSVKGQYGAVCRPRARVGNIVNVQRN